MKILITILLLTVNCFPALNLPPTSKEKQYLNRNELLKDPSFEMGGKASAVTTQPNYSSTGAKNGRQLLWNPVGADILTLDSEDIPADVGGYLHAKCYAALIDETHTYTLEIYDTTNSLLVASTDLPSSNSGNFLPVEAESIIVPSGVSRTFKVRIQATANEAVLNVDDCAFWLDDEAKVETVITSPQTYTPDASINQGFGTMGTSTLKWARFGSYVSIQGAIVCGTPSAAEGRIALPDELTSASDYDAVSDIGSVSDSASVARYTVLIEPSKNYMTFGYRSATGTPISKRNGNSICSGAGSVMHINAWIRIQGWDSGLNVTNKQVDWRVDANISGANPSLGTSAVTTYTGITNSSLTLTNNTSKGSLTNVYIACSSTNDSTGTTCSVGDESVGIAFTPPTAGYVQVCASFAHQAQTGAGGAAQATFQIVKTPNDAQTILEEGGQRIESNNATANANITTPNTRCGEFFLDSVSKHTFRLMYEQFVAGTVTSSSIRGDANSVSGQRDIHWSVTPLVKYGNVLVANNLEIAKGEGEISKGAYEFWGYYGGNSTNMGAACTSSPCTLSETSFGTLGVTVTRSGTGTYSIDVPSGTCNGVLNCSIHCMEPGVGGAYSTPTSAAKTSTAYTFVTRTTNTNSVDSVGNFHCRCTR